MVFSVRPVWTLVGCSQLGAQKTRWGINIRREMRFFCTSWKSRIRWLCPPEIRPAYCDSTANRVGMELSTSGSSETARRTAANQAEITNRFSIGGEYQDIFPRVHTCTRSLCAARQVNEFLWVITRSWVVRSEAVGGALGKFMIFLSRDGRPPIFLPLVLPAITFVDSSIDDTTRCTLNNVIYWRTQKNNVFSKDRFNYVSSFLKVFRKHVNRVKFTKQKFKIFSWQNAHKES